MLQSTKKWVYGDAWETFAFYGNLVIPCLIACSLDVTSVHTHTIPHITKWCNPMFMHAEIHACKAAFVPLHLHIVLRIHVKEKVCSCCYMSLKARLRARCEHQYWYGNGVACFRLFFITSNIWTHCPHQFCRPPYMSNQCLQLTLCSCTLACKAQIWLQWKQLFDSDTSFLDLCSKEMPCQAFLGGFLEQLELVRLTQDRVD